MKLFLIDGHALVFKMYYAFLGRPMMNSKGVDTSILFGFTKYLLELIDREKPTHIAVSFDPPGGTFRNVMYPAYKANRAETPQLVIDALEPLISIVGALDIPVLMVKGFEADDVIGSAAKRFAAEGMDVYMVTPDKDYGQLTGEHIFQYKPGKAGSDHEILSEKEVCGKWGIDSSSQVIDLLAICGDTADNVPGVSGVGPVGASKLLKKYGSMESVYEHLDELTPAQKSRFEAARGHISLSKELVTIKTDIDLDVKASDLILDMAYTTEVQSLFNLYEFPSLVRLVRNISVGLHERDGQTEEPAVPAAPAGYEKVSPSDIAAREVAVNLKGDVLYVCADSKVSSGNPSVFRNMLENPEIIKAGYAMKPQLKALEFVWGIQLKGHIADVELMHYLIDPERSHKLDSLCSAYLGIDLNEGGGEQVPLSLFDEQPEDPGADFGKETWAVFCLYRRIRAVLSEDATLERLYRTVEEPLLPVLARMEQAGVKVDMRALSEYADSLRERMVDKEREVRELAGEPALNVSSPKQIGTVIFEKLCLDPKAKKPRSGNWPTDEQTLQELSDRSPIIDAILEYRGLRKLLSTYIEPFPTYVSPSDGRIHTTFNQTLTSTGRLSSSGPNLQNIPIRTDDGREIRRAFVPGSPDNVLMSADYSQIELRIMAHLSGDAHLCEAFRAGEDVHRATAARIFHISPSEVTSDQRRVAKTANFGIMYGISAFGLSQRLKCSRNEAKQIIDDYFTSFPSIRGWIDGTLASARANGYVETLFGRRRYVPDVNSANANVRSLAERNAVNAPIQGTSADIIKLAMVGVDRSLREEGLLARMVLQIHDELVLELPRSEVPRVRDLLVSEMEGVMPLSVPLTVECNYGDTWLEAH